MAKILAFKLWGDYAHFKKFYTTTSPLTFEFAPPSTLIGIISAILGFDKETYWNQFQELDKFFLGLKILHPVKKVRWTQNLINTKEHFWNIQSRTQIRTEFLKDVSYMVYFYHENQEIYERLKFLLKHHESVYTVSLGLSNLLGNFEFSEEMEMYSIQSEEYVEIHSVLPCHALIDDSSIKFAESDEIFKVSYPFWMKTNREVYKREDILFERQGKPLVCKVKHYWKTEKGDNIVFF